MAFCPGCGYEFRQGLRRCPDCDMDLVAELEETEIARLGRLRGGNTVSVFTSERPRVEMLADMLEVEGVPSVVKAVNPSSDPPPAPMAELHILEQDAEANQGLIQELIAEVTGQAPTE